MDNFKPGLLSSNSELKQKYFKEEEKPVIDLESAKHRNFIDSKMGYSNFDQGEPRLGWLVDISETIVEDPICPEGRSGIDLYFFQDDGSSFKATLLYDHYFYVLCTDGYENEVEEFLVKKYPKYITKSEIVEKDDLDLVIGLLTKANHLVGKKRKAVKISFCNFDHLKNVKSYLMQTAAQNRNRATDEEMYEGIFSNDADISEPFKSSANASEYIMELREHDLMYYTRVTIDQDIRVGLWYKVSLFQGTLTLEPRPDIVRRADPVVLAFDIETTKLPLKFPDSSFDSVMMISYMIDGVGFLITNREIVSQDIDDFEYTPKPEYQGLFHIFNEKNEKDAIQRFFNHIIAVKPTVFVTYNGDFFDWPFICDRAAFHGVDMYSEIGFKKNGNGEFLASYASHMDCFCWVKRDSYLPQGSQNLKAVATYKLGYNPVEIDPEDMTRFASERPQVLAQYSVSDAVATYYLYMKYVHPFTFSLCNIIPLNPDDVLRRGSGTLCEHLLMVYFIYKVQSFKANVIMPNKHSDISSKFYDNHLINSETYVGGHVEALEAGIFRSDLPVNFKLDSSAFQKLIDEIDSALEFSITTEGNHQLSDVTNYSEVRQKIVQSLEELRDTPHRKETPLIYHLDVGAMYPNIILTNRLQPDAMVTDAQCATCDFNDGAESECQRRMQWSWRGELMVSTRGEYNMIRNQLEQEKFPPKFDKGADRFYHELPKTEQESILKKRLSDYTRKIYGKLYTNRIIEKTSIVCQRENPFYIDTVRNFRDRRYDYKALLKEWKQKLYVATKAEDASGIDEAARMIVIFDSLQLAHKCILNSFYGYVMRKGARWYSMEMAGIVCLTGAKIIQLARSRVEKIGRPLELDTDGIWCILPASFPENFIFKLRNGKSYSISYPCVMLNHLVHDQFTNHQYMDLVNPTIFDYKSRKENSIFFEVDGPYRAMILPASTEEDKLLKKRYAVFNHDGTLAELKGFEIKRRGELKLIKNFQGSIFKVFLEGDSLENCYKAVATIANQWIDILDSKGQNITDNELFDLLTENRSMSKALSEYGSQKSTSITAAKRLAELLGDHMVTNSGTACKFIISASPNGAPVSERAVPIAIFYLDGDTRKKFLSKWLKESVQDSEDVRDILDWDYYLERFGSVIQKLITIPAASQSVPNPVPRIKHPEWLQKRLASQASKTTQRLITDMLSPVLEIPRDLDCPTSKKENVPDLEDIGYTRPLLPNGKRHLKTPLVVQKRRKKQTTPLHPELVSENPHDFRTNYRLWLSAQKPIWIRRLKDKLNSAAKLRLGQQTKLSAYFAQNVINMEIQTWKVLHVSDTDSQGIFRLWVSINGNLEGVDIDVPRVIYINSKIDDLSEYLDVRSMQITKVSRKLPRGHISYNLFEISMSEYTYRMNSGKLSSIFQEKFVAGVYETQVPLDFRVLLELGLYVKPKLSRESLDRTVPLPFSRLQQVSQKSSNYLTVSDLDIMYLYHSRSGSRHFMCLFFVATGEVYIEVVDTNKRFEVPDVARRIYKEFADQNESNSFFPTTIFVSTTSWTNESNLFSSINGKILAFKRKNGKLPVILFQATNTPKYYRNNGFSSMREIPYLVVPNHKSDDTFPALSWAQYCITRMTGHFFNLDTFLQEKFHLACFSNVPVCNIENDSAVFLSDLFLARRLKLVDHVLWASPSPKPDLGGSEQDDHRSFLEEFKLPEINNTSSYPKICIEMEIWDLALNTLLKCVGFGNELEALNHGKSTKTNLLDDTFGMNKKNMLADMESPQNAITQIKGMIKDWVQQVRYGNKFASQLLEHLHRWLTNRNSLFYDGLVVGHLLKLMKRCLGSLLSELRKLGCTIVYASFDRLVVETNKNAAPLGLAYFSYVLMTLTKNPTFEHIELKPVGVWDFLLWYDKNNYSTFSCNEILDDSFALSKDSDVDSKLDMNWSVLDYLPPVIQSHLLQSFAQFLFAVKKMKKDGQENELSKFVANDMKRTLLGRVRDILHRKYDEESELSFEQQYAFPTLPGIENEPMEPALEFIKIITMFIGLNRQLGNETRLLKRDLLKLVEITEFSEKAKFSNPVQKYVLKQVICDYCNYCSDLDLTQKTIDGDFLHCQGCTMVYNSEEVEQLLIQELTGFTTLWQLQDLVCQTCKQIRSELIPEYCIRCSGKVDTVMQKSEQEQRIKLLRGIAKFYRMQDLLEVCSFYLDFKAVENGNIIN